MKRASLYRYLFALTALAASPVTGAIVGPRQQMNYSGLSNVALNDIQTFDLSLSGEGQQWGYSINAGYFHFKTKAVLPVQIPIQATFFMGVWTQLNGEETTEHLVLAVNPDYASRLVEDGRTFDQIFTGFSEAKLVSDLITITDNIPLNLLPGDPAYAAEDAAESELENFDGAIDAETVNGGAFSLVAFSAASIVGQGTAVTALISPVSPLPEPANWMMMALGFGMVGAIIRRRAICDQPIVSR